MGLAATVGAIGTIMLPVTLHLLTDAIPRLSKIAVSRAAKRMPHAIRRDQEAAWLADLAVLETDIERLRCAIGCWSTSIALRWPLALEQSEHHLRVARTTLKLHGAIASYALGRIKAWNTSQDASEWSFAERWIFGVIVESGKSLPLALKHSSLVLKQILKHGPEIIWTSKNYRKNYSYQYIVKCKSSNSCRSIIWL